MQRESGGFDTGSCASLSWVFVPGMNYPAVSPLLGVKALSRWSASGSKINEHVVPPRQRFTSPTIAYIKDISDLKALMKSLCHIYTH